MSLTLYGFWRSLATLRVRIALNLKGLDFAEPQIDLLKGDQFSAAYRRVNPLSVIPALDLGDGRPALVESLAILEYLDETHPTPPLLPTGARARARVRGLAQIVACDAHPLVVPRIRTYLEKDLGLDEPARNRWIQRWIDEASRALEAHLAGSDETGRFCQGDQVTIADVCLVSHVVGAHLFKCDMAPYATVNRIVGECMKLDVFAKAHPLKQPGAPAAPH
jgi:maleylacetoacetate isomerase